MKLLQQLGAALPQIGAGRSAARRAEPDEARLYNFGARGGGVRSRMPQPAPTSQPPSAPGPETAPLGVADLEPEALSAPGGSARSQVPPAPTPTGRTASTDSTDISATADIPGFVASCLVDSESGLMLASEGGENIDLEAAAALNTQVVRAEHEVIEVLQLDDHIEDILITMSRQLHFIRPLEASPQVFLYVCLDKKAANLGMARMQVNKIEGGLRME